MHCLYISIYQDIQSLVSHWKGTSALPIYFNLSGYPIFSISLPGDQCIAYIFLSTVSGYPILSLSLQDQIGSEQPEPGLASDNL